MSNLLSLRDSEVSTTTANSNKDAEIKDLKSQLAILEAKNAQRVGLNQSPHPTLLQQRSFSEADTQRISPGALVSTSSTFSSQEKSKSSSILNVTSLSSKSIWAPVSSVSTSSIQSIGYFNTTDVPSPVRDFRKKRRDLIFYRSREKKKVNNRSLSQVTVVESPSDVLDEKDSSIPAAHINQYRALWSPLDAPTESPTDFNSEVGDMQDYFFALFLNPPPPPSSPFLVKQNFER